MVFKIKRYEFGIVGVVIALFAAAAGISLVSAYGAACVAWDPTYWGRAIPPPPAPPMTIMFEYLIVYGPLFQVMNVITWITSFLLAFLIFAIIIKFKFAWEISLVTSILGFIAGVVPAVIADTNGGTEAFEMGSPHWAKTIVNLIVMIVLFVPWVRSSIKSYAASESTIARTVGRQLVVISMIFFWLSIISFTGTHFMAEAHVVSGINVWELIDIQTYGAVATLIGGISTLSVGLIYNKIKPPHSLITPSEKR
jgi:hypothetical protein